MHKTVRVREHSTMERIVRQVESQRGKTLLEDENYFQYASNGHGIHTNRWRCTKRSCSATVTTRKSTGRLTNTSLPTHNHSNNKMKQCAQQTEKTVIDQFAHVPTVTPTSVLQEISSNMLASRFPG